MDGRGAVDPEPLAVAGVECFTDLEGIAASPDGRIYLIASQLAEGSGNRRRGTTIFISARFQANTIQADSYVSFRDLLVEAGRSDPGYFAALGLDDAKRKKAPDFEIEGLAWHRGALFFGLKNPLDSSGQALIWKLENPDSLFQHKKLSRADLRLWNKVRLPLAGRMSGISELLFLPDNSLLLAATGSAGGALFHVMVASDGKLNARTLKTFAGLSPEGLCLSPDNRLVVVFDQQRQAPQWMLMELPQ
jgi:hypothetical protein